MKSLEERKIRWLQQLSELPPASALPFERERPPVPSFLRETASLVLAPDVCVALKALAEEEGVSAFSVLMAAFTSVLSRYTGQMEIVTGTLLGPVDDREPHARAILRTRMSAEQTTRELIRHVEA